MGETVSVRFRFFLWNNGEVSHTKRLATFTGAADRFLAGVTHFNGKLGTIILQMGSNFSPDHFQRVTGFVEYWPGELPWRLNCGTIAGLAIGLWHRNSISYWRRIVHRLPSTHRPSREAGCMDSPGSGQGPHFYPSEYGLGVVLNPEVVYRSECRPTRLPSVSSKWPTKPNSPIELFGFTTVPPLGTIFLRVTATSSTLR